MHVDLTLILCMHADMPLLVSGCDKGGLSAYAACSEAKGVQAAT